MLANSLFYAGLVIMVITGIISWISKGEDKRGVVAFPFSILLSAAVAKYLGL